MTKEFLRMKLADLVPYENNPRHNEEAVDATIASMQQCGNIDPIEVDENNVILSGHTRRLALMKMGYEESDVVRVSGLTDLQKKKYRILANKTNEFAGWDFGKLEEELDGLDFEGFDFGFEDFTDVGASAVTKPNTGVAGSLSADFIIPPFSIFDTRAGKWLERKRKWREIIKDDATTRGTANLMSDNLSRYDGQPTMALNSLLDPVLAEIIISWFMPEEDNGVNVFDTFAGDTVFGFVAGYKGKNFTGIELREEQALYNEKSCAEYNLNAHYICDDGRNIRHHIGDDTQDLYFSCPPYYDLEVYSNLPNDASNQKTYEEFYSILDTAFRESCKCLKNNRFAVVVASDMRGKNGAYYDFVGDIKNTFKSCGLCLYNEIILVNSVGSGAIRARKMMDVRKTVRLHQEVLVFYKGNPKKIREEFGTVEVEDIESEDS